MLTAPLPGHADLRKLAAAGSALAGVIKLQSMPRLCAVLASESGQAEVSIELGMSAERLRVMEGSARAQVLCICQRCLGEMELALEARFALAMIWGDQDPGALPSRFDALVVGAEPADLFGIVEDELLLALPFAPCHEDTGCNERLLAESLEPAPATENAGALGRALAASLAKDSN